MLVDTDVIIWSLRGDNQAERALQSLNGFVLSSVSYMELVQGLRNNREFSHLRQALSFWSAKLVPLDETVSSRAMFLLEQHALGDGLRLADALIAATAMVHGATLFTGNARHYRAIRGLTLEVFRPTKR